MRRRVAVVWGSGIALAALGAACAASGGDAATHGPIFDLDGGASGDSSSSADDAPVTTDHDAHVPGDASALGDVAISEDGSAGGDSYVDAGEQDDAADSAVDSGPPCTAMTVVLAGSTSSLSGAVAVGTGAFTVQAITGSAALTPAVVATSSGFEALVPMSGDAGGGYPLFGLGFSGGAWSSPAVLGSTASAIDAPGLALLGSNVEAAYLDPQHLYFHAEWAGSSWNAGTDPVTPEGGVQSFGPVRASAAATTTELVLAYEGNNEDLYAQSWAPAGGWRPAVQIGTGTLATNTPPAIVALTLGGTDDFLVVYDAPASPPSEQHIYYSLRTASTKTWSSPVQIDATIYSPDAPSLAPMTGGRALLGWRGGNQMPYTAEYDPPAVSVWSAAKPLGSGTVTAAPSLATGICGDDAVAAVITGGSVSVGQYASGVWQTPVAISGTSAAQLAAIATSP